MEKFKNKYRIPSNRWQKWYYSSRGTYFVTICTQNRVNYLGEIIDNEMKLSEIGEISYRFWFEIPNHFSFVLLDEFVVMPNHIHGIIIINDNVPKSIIETPIIETPIVETPDVEMPNLGVSTGEINKKRTHNASLKWKSGTLGVVINQYKRICTINARKTDPNFAWQPNYHDHIIKTNQAYENIKNYISNNPKNWQNDKLHT